MEALEFRVLGTLEVWRGGRLVPVGAARQRDVLAALLLEANRVVAVERLIGLVWGEAPPSSARNTVQTLVRRLRRRLVDPPDSAHQPLQTRPPGYLLAVAWERFDLARFQDLLRRGREALEAGFAEEAVRLLRDAAALWRGRALDGVSAEPLLRVERPRLHELYQQVLELRMEAHLRLGQYAEVIGELRRLIAEHPLREGPYGQLMRALYGCGRQAEALDVYRSLHQVLDDELGVEPGPALQRLHQAVLRGELAAEPGRVGSSPVVVAGGAGPVPAQLPADVAGFTGRADELGWLDKLLAAGWPEEPTAPPAAPVVAVAVVGTAGVGKTALTLHWAHRVRHRFPDGQFYVDLHGYSPAPPVRPIDCLGQFLRALGVDPERVPVDPQEAAGLYRSLLADRRVLVVLDNAGSAEQVRPLLPGSPGCLTVVTSRERLDGLVVRDGAHRLVLDVLPAADAQTLLRRTIGDRSADGRPEDDPSQGLVELARLCAHLPLALRIAAADLAGRPVTVPGYVRRLRARGELTGLSVPGDEQTAVRGAFSLSYSTLPDEVRRLFRLLGTVPVRDVTAAAAAAVAGVAVAEAERLLDVLAAAHLVHELADGRYTSHDLLRQYARELAGAAPEAERTGALTRWYEWCLAATDRAARLLYPEILRLPATGDPEPAGPPAPEVGTAAEALSWLDAERANLVVAVRYAAEHGRHRAAYRLADALRGYFEIRPHVNDRDAVCRAAVAAAEAADDPLGQAAGQLGLADRYRQQHRYRAAMDHYRRAAALAEQADWPVAQAAALMHLGAMYGETGRLAEEVEHVTRALEIYRREGHRTGQAACLGNLGVACLELGRLDESAAYCRQALTFDREQGSRIGQAHTLTNLGEAHLEGGQPDSARRCLTRALELFRQVGGRVGEAKVLALLAEVHRRDGALARARAVAEDSLAVTRDIPDAEGNAYARWCEVMARNALGAAYLHSGQPRRAVAEHQRALQLVREGGNPYPEAQTLLGLAMANLGLPRPDPVAAYAGQALSIARERGYRLLEARAAEILRELPT